MCVLIDKYCSYSALRDFKEKDTENEVSAQSVSLNLVVMNSYKKRQKKSFPVRTVISMHAGTEHLLRCHAVIYNDNAIGTFSNI